MPQVPNSTTPRIVAIPSPSLNDENPSIGGTRLGGHTQSSSRVNWRLQEVMVLVEAEKDLHVGKRLQKLVDLVERIAPRANARQSGSSFAPCSLGFVTSSAKYHLVATVIGKWMRSSGARGAYRSRNSPSKYMIRWTIFLVAGKMWMWLDFCTTRSMTTRSH
ncbi:hypothetical protein GOP47_0021337 [Adiantum capillus-veneris]|uniref:Uncharacterized protein n=1 Tax=Adiantum capillus-veneris TaxID=13818 RepID=A0A9D4U7X9_ADICA|nr:hypothetical protein GOP47_0021337 [Adiantum capillus-veneris]